MRYIILDSQKRPTHAFKNGVGAKTWQEVKDFDNIGLIIPEPYIVLDFDNIEDARIMLKIIEELDLKCKVMKTNRGIHVWFRSAEPWKCFILTRLGIGIYSDCKSHSKNAYVKIKDAGHLREWIRKCSDEDIQEVPKWLYPVSSPSNQFNFKAMGEGSGRNQELFNYIVYLQSKGFTREEIKETINIINRFVFTEPLDDYEISTICRDEAFKSDEEIKKQEEQKERHSGFKHNLFGDELIETYNIITVNNQLYVYEHGYYQQDERIIERKMIELFPSIKNSQRSEVLSYIRIMTHMHVNDLKINPFIINLKNTRYDIRTGECLDFTPDAIEFDRIPVIYDPDAYSEDLDKMLNRVFLDDKEVRELFEEMIGACLLKHNRYQKAFMAYGSGSNGKSTIFDLIKKFLGARNFTTMNLEQVVSRFGTAMLENKLANIGDDIDNDAIKHTGTLKKIVSGNSLQVEHKGEKMFTIEPYATHIYSANEIPRSFDKTDGFYRRWMFIPFNAKFSPTDENYDPFIEEKITTDEALSYLLNLAIKGAERLLKQGHFTEPICVKKALEMYKTENSTVLTWIEDAGYDIDYFTTTPTTELYSNFVDWCKLSGVKTNNITGKKAFFKEVSTKFDFEDKQRQRHGGKRYFVVKID